MNEHPQYPQRPYLPLRPVPASDAALIALEPLPRRGESIAPGQASEPNDLLRRLPAEEYARLEPHLVRLTITAPRRLAEAGSPLSYAHFPGTGVVSVVRRTEDGKVVETGAVGREGMAEIGVLFGIAWSPAILQVQVTGTFTRIPVARLRELLPELPVLRDRLGRFAFAFMDQAGQSVACNSAHTVRQRCARWLLQMHDSVGLDELQLTHSAMAEMLSVRRAGVTDATMELQREGLIRKGRGRVVVTDRAGLEAAACQCYAVIRGNRERMLGGVAGMEV